MAPFGLLIFFSLLGSAVSLQCSVLNSIPGISTMVCPGNVNSCMKFVCKMSGSQTIAKGCNDPANPPVSCSQLLNNCQAQGGKGNCYTCSNGDYCNSSPLSGISLGLLSSLVFPLLLR